jgi:3-dehydroquinate synthetase
MQKDKNVLDGKLTLILARGIGQSFVVADADAALVRETLEEALIP